MQVEFKVEDGERHITLSGRPNGGLKLGTGIIAGNVYEAGLTRSEALVVGKTMIAMAESVSVEGEEEEG